MHAHFHPICFCHLKIGQGLQTKTCPSNFLNHLYHRLNFDRHPRRERVGSGSNARVLTRLSKKSKEQIRRSVKHLRVLSKVWPALHHTSNADDSDDARKVSIQHSCEMAQDIQSAELRSTLPIFDTEIGTNFSGKEELTIQPWPLTCYLDVAP
jgi:hypothetical protein